MRLEYRIEVKGKNNRTLATTETFNKTPETVTAEIRGAMIKGEFLKREYAESPLETRLKFKGGYNSLEIVNEGKIQTANMTIILRKSK